MNYFLIFFMVLLLATPIWILIRNNNVCKLRLKINQMCYEYAIRHNLTLEAWEPYKKLPSYNKMLYSLKPLRVDYWLSPEDIYKLEN